MLTQEKERELQNFAREIRIQTIRQIGIRGFGHIGGCMSIADLLSVLYGEDMKYDPQNPSWEGRDWLVCSKGHAGPAIYAALALKGFFPMEWMETLNQPGTNLPSHCDRRKTPGIDMTTGSLGQGLSIAAGIAQAYLLNEKKNTVYCIMGDGESQEGQNWEAILYAAQQKLGNLILFVDDNKAQIDGYVSQINEMESYVDKFKSFHWDAVEINGHDYNAIHEAILNAKAVQDKPSAIILHTIKGKGCTFAERTWCHHISVSKEDMEEALVVIIDHEREICTQQNHAEDHRHDAPDNKQYVALLRQELHQHRRAREGQNHADHGAPARRADDLLAFFQPRFREQELQQRVDQKADEKDDGADDQHKDVFVHPASSPAGADSTYCTGMS